MAGGESSLRNAMKRVAHKERAQPAYRKKLGLLEKHKDYVQRAQDYNHKRKILKSLRRKAENRNPDEFYFKMNRSQISNGVHKENSNDTSFDHEILKLLKTQDLGYIVHKMSIDQKKANKLSNSLHLIDHDPQNTHIIFDDKPEKESMVPDRNPEVEDEPRIIDVSSMKKILKEKDNSYREVQERSNRANKLKKAFFALTQQRNLTSRSAKKIVMKKDVQDDAAPKYIYKWKKERAK